MKFHFKKHFGQNFLRNKNIIWKIVNSIPKKYDEIYEIGPGQGALTQFLLGRFAKVIAIEIDQDCVKILSEKFIDFSNLEIISADVLKYDFAPNSVIIGNLPYNIGTKIIENFLHNPIDFGVFMLQKEVAQRMSGVDFCRLSVLIQSVYDVKKITDVSPEDFVPKPKVHSQVISLQKHCKFVDVDLERLKKMTSVVFQNPRKKLSALKKSNLAILAELEKFGVDLNLRPEKIPKEIFYKICTKNAEKMEDY